MLACCIPLPATAGHAVTDELVQTPRFRCAQTRGRWVCALNALCSASCIILKWDHRSQAKSRGLRYAKYAPAAANF